MKPSVTPISFRSEDDVIDEDELLNILNEGKTHIDNDAITSAKKSQNSKEGDLNTDVTNKDEQPSKKKPSQVSKENTNDKPEIIPESKETAAPPPAQPSVEINTLKESSFSNLTSMELIFLGYAKQLQKMPLPLQLQTKRKIADIMDEVELKMMEQM